MAAKTMKVLFLPIFFSVLNFSVFAGDFFDYASKMAAQIKPVIAPLGNTTGGDALFNFAEEVYRRRLAETFLVCADRQCKLSFAHAVRISEFAFITAAHVAEYPLKTEQLEKKPIFLCSIADNDCENIISIIPKLNENIYIHSKHSNDNDLYADIAVIYTKNADENFVLWNPANQILILDLSSADAEHIKNMLLNYSPVVISSHGKKDVGFYNKLSYPIVSLGLVPQIIFSNADNTIIPGVSGSGLFLTKDFALIGIASVMLPNVGEKFFAYFNPQTMPFLKNVMSKTGEKFLIKTVR